MTYRHLSRPQYIIGKTTALPRYDILIDTLKAIALAYLLCGAALNAHAAEAPAPPMDVDAVAGDTNAIINFTAASENRFWGNHENITYYTVTSSPGGLTANGSKSPITISGLTNGITYTFRVTASNVVGTSRPSDTSNHVTPFGLPSPPTTVHAVAGNASVTVTFSGALANGSAITSYMVTSFPGLLTAAGPASPITITGLKNNTKYTFTVTAINGIEKGAASNQSNTVTPQIPQLPGAPSMVTAVAGNTSATVTFNAPSVNNSNITGYTVTSSPGGLTASGPTSPITVVGLTNGKSYTFTVAATNRVGTGASSGASNSVTPLAPKSGVPTPPVTITALAGNTQAVVYFSGASANGSPITRYTVISSPGAKTVTGSTNTLTVGGLTNGTAYTFTVTATNAIGTSVASVPSNKVIPAGVPTTPRMVFAQAGNAQASVSFSMTIANQNGSSLDNGNEITSYTATSSPGGIKATGTNTPIIVTGLSNGTAYTFSVTATNAIGSSTPSSASNSVTPTVTTNGIPSLQNVNIAIPHANGARIEFDPFPGAQDYRAYAVNNNGTPVQPVIYYCAGKRTWDLLANQQGQYPSEIPVVTGPTHGGYTRNSAVDLTMGYVNTLPGAGLIPVYALGSPSPSMGDVYNFIAGRQTIYTTDQTAYQNYVNQGWRDEGIQFYVPVPTQTKETLNKVYSVNENDWNDTYSLLYFIQGPEYTYRVNTLHDIATPSFQVFANSALGRVPLQRMTVYTPGGEMDTLWPGGSNPTFSDMFNEGNQVLVRSISISGITKPTNFAVEALDSGCPYQGAETAMSAPQITDGKIYHFPWYTMAQMQSQNPDGVYLNGQFNPTNTPHAIGRSIVTITPQARMPATGNWDYFLNFGTLNPTPVFTKLPNCGVPGTNPNCWGAEAFTSSIGNAYFIATIPGLRAVGVNNGQLTMRIADYGSDVNGKVQLPLNTPANYGTGYLHLTWDTEFIPTGRRYGQIYISDQAGAPFYNMANGNSIIIQSRHVGTHNMAIEVCDHQRWDTNDQCPGYRFDSAISPDGDPYFSQMRPIPALEQFSGVSRMTKYDFYVSTQKAFLFMDDKPIGCVNLPAGHTPEPGDVHITLSDTSYHSGVDDHFNVWEGVKTSNEIEESKDFNNVGWQSKVAEPAWDYSTYPCVESSSNGVM